MLVERADVVGDVRQVVVGFLVRRATGAAVEEGNALVQHAGVAGRADVAADGQGQPEVVVGEVRAHAAARRRMPPVLHVPFAELARGGAEQVLAEQPRLGMHQGHRVLQLVAEAERAARLIEARARPHAAGQRLIDEPAVGQEVDGRVGRFDSRPRPASGSSSATRPRAPDGRCRRRGSAERGVVASASLRAAPRVKTMSVSCPSSSVSGDLNGGARVESRADAAGEPHAAQGRGVGQRAVAAEELGAVAGDGADRFAAVDEGDPVAELGAVRVAREERAAGRVESRSPRASAILLRSSPRTNSQ